MHELSVTCNALWKRSIKMVEDRKNSNIFKTSYKKNAESKRIAPLVKNPSGKILYFILCILIPENMSLGNYFLVPLF